MLSRIIVISAGLLLACGLGANAPGLAGGEVETVATRTPMPTFTPTPPIEALVTIERPTPVPTVPAEAEGGDTGDQSSDPGQSGQEPPQTDDEPAAEPTGEPPPEAPSLVKVPVSATANVNVRDGPGTGYPVVGQAAPGQSSEAIGRNPDATWLYVVYPPGPGGFGWISAAYLAAEGDVNSLAVMEVAPPPQAAAPPANSPPPENNPPPGPPPCEQQYQFCPAGWFTDHNEALVHFRGVIKNTGGGGVNGFSVRISNGSLSLLSFPSGPSSVAPDWHDGKWDIALNTPPIAQYFGTWTVQVVRYECPDFFNAQCDQFVPLSEAVPIVIEPGAEVIVADWICHRDCDQGIRR
ncbi:MAG: SH3 domain-containing protein [Anaerolineae bacterium]